MTGHVTLKLTDAEAECLWRLVCLDHPFVGWRRFALGRVYRKLGRALGRLG